MINLDENTHKIQIVGKLTPEIIKLTGISLLEDNILMYPGVIKHIKKNHPNEFSMYFKKIPDIVNFPDYVGVHPGEPNSIEFVKVLDDNILIAIKLSPKGYLYLSSMYMISQTKVSKRLKSGRLIKVIKKDSP
jgi:hypothetical protein